MIVTGRIEQGCLEATIATKTGTTGMPVKFYPSGLVGKVGSIEAHHTSIPKAHCGDNVGVQIKGFAKGRQPKNGEVMVRQDAAELDGNDQVMGSTKSFVAKFKVQEHP